MNQHTLLVGLGGLIIGVIIAGGVVVGAVNSNNFSMMQMIGMHPQSIDNSGMTMDGMVGSLKDKTGDDFDKAFLTEMIQHHQGAIDMAKLAQTQAKHVEIKTLAHDILSAQSKEIDLMQTWQGDWGYKVVPSMMMSH
jgi:uncharacterized protein (DUF305 family)